MKKAILLLTLVSAFSLSTYAQQQSRGERKPPKEAIEACENKSEGESVSFENRRGDSLSATCQLINNSLVAVPEGHSERPKREQN